MKNVVFSAVLLVFSGMLPLAAQARDRGSLLIPDTSMERPQDRGLRAHTNHLIFVRPNFTGTSPSGETPQSLRSVYKLPSTGGGGIIAIVDAFHYPTAANDLNVFSKQFGLPSCTTSNGCFRVVFASGSQPRTNCGWAQEAALDIEWAHAMAPSGHIVLVEAASNSFSDLFRAIDVATSIVTTGGHHGEVSMSWGGGEFSSETSFDSHFRNSGVVYFAASGDTGGKTIYPSVSQEVVSAGGTSVNRSSSGAFLSETGWSGSGGGPSSFELKPSYQVGVGGTSSTRRSTPDFSFDANPSTGVSVYDSTQCQGLSGWLVFGGTSVSSPSLAGVVNLAHSLRTSPTSSTGELTLMYANRTNSSDFRDILSGTAGSFSAHSGWDFVTGIGSDQGTSGK